MPKSNNIAKTVIIMMIFTFGSKALGFGREVLIAAKFGASMEADSFFIAFAAVSLFTTLITQGVNTTMIPMLAEIEDTEGKEVKKKNANNLLNVILLFCIFFVVIGWFLAPYIINILAYGFQGEQFDLTVKLMRIGLPVVFFAGIVGVFRGYLQSESKFIDSAIADYPLNLVYIFFLIFLSSQFGIQGLMVASVLAVGAQILTQIPALKKVEFNYKLILELKNKYLKKISLLLPPVFLTVAINSINEIVDKTLASGLIAGSVSALNYGNRLKNLVLEVFITVISTVIFPTLAKEANKSDYTGLRTVIRYGINTIMLITIPATLGIIVLGEQIVSLAFERGAFNSKDTSMTTGAFVFYSLGLSAMGVRTFLNRVYYSIQDTKTPMYNGIVTVIANIVLNLILVRYMESNGIALATAITATITATILLIGINKKVGHLEYNKFFKCIFKALVASLIMAIIVHLTNWYLHSIFSMNFLFELFLLILSSVLGMFIYILIVYLLKLEEIHWLINLLKGKFLTGRNGK